MIYCLCLSTLFKGEFPRLPPLWQIHLNVHILYMLTYGGVDLVESNMEHMHIFPHVHTSVNLVAYFQKFFPFFRFAG